MILDILLLERWKLPSRSRRWWSGLANLGFHGVNYLTRIQGVTLAIFPQSIQSWKHIYNIKTCIKYSKLKTERRFKQGRVDNFFVCLRPEKLFENVPAKCLHEKCEIMTWWANARNVRPYYPHWQYTDLFIFQFVSPLCLRSTLRLFHGSL